MKQWVNKFLHIREKFPERILRPVKPSEEEMILDTFEDLFERNLPIQVAHVSYGSEEGSHNKVVEEIGLEQIDEGLLVYGSFMNVMSANVLKGKNLARFGLLDIYFKKNRQKIPTPKIDKLKVFFIFEKEAQIMMLPRARKRFTIKDPGKPLGVCMIINGQLYAANVGTVGRIPRILEKYMGWVTPRRRR